MTHSLLHTHVQTLPRAYLLCGFCSPHHKIYSTVRNFTSESSKWKAAVAMSSNKFSELIARKWRRLAAARGERRRSKGHFVVYARGGKRFVVPLHYLDHPIFQVLLEMAEEEFGTMVHGPLQVPCEEELMDYIVSLLRTNPTRQVEKALPSSLFHLCHVVQKRDVVVL